MYFYAYIDTNIYHIYYINIIYIYMYYRNMFFFLTSRSCMMIQPEEICWKWRKDHSTVRHSTKSAWTEKKHFWKPVAEKLITNPHSSIHYTSQSRNCQTVPPGDAEIGRATGRWANRKSLRICWSKQGKISSNTISSWLLLAKAAFVTSCWMYRTRSCYFTQLCFWSFPKLSLSILHSTPGWQVDLWGVYEAGDVGSLACRPGSQGIKGGLKKCCHVGKSWNTWRNTAWSHRQDEVEKFCKAMSRVFRHTCWRYLNIRKPAISQGRSKQRTGHAPGVHIASIKAHRNNVCPCPPVFSL